VKERGPTSKDREGRERKLGLLLRAGRGRKARRGEGGTWTPPGNPNPATPLMTFRDH